MNNTDEALRLLRALIEAVAVVHYLGVTERQSMLDEAYDKATAFSKGIEFPEELQS